MSKQIYLPLWHAKNAMDGLNNLRTFLNKSGLDKESKELTNNNLLKMCTDDKFYSLEYEGPLKKFNNLLFLNPSLGYQQFGQTHNLQTEWRDMFSMASIIGKWAENKQVYEFDKDFAMELIKTKNIKMYPHLLKHLPYNTFYLDFSKIEEFKPFDGVFVHVEVKNDDEVYVFMNRIVKEVYYTCTLRFIKEESKEEENITYYEIKKENLNTVDTLPISPALQKEMGNIVLDNSRFIDIEMLIFQFLVYLASSKPDIEESELTKKTYKPSQIIRNKYSEIRKWDVGVIYGSTIRKWKTDSSTIENTKKNEEEGMDNENQKKITTRKPVRPHSRCAHWHHYWTGKGRTKLEVRWIEPSFVGRKTNIPTTIHKVKG